MGACFVLAAIFIRADLAYLALASITCFILTYQAMIWSAFWVCAAEIITETGLGIALFVLVFTGTIVTLCIPYLIETYIDISNMIYNFAGVELVPCILFYFYMRETKSCTHWEK